MRCAFHLCKTCLSVFCYPLADEDTKLMRTLDLGARPHAFQAFLIENSEQQHNCS